MVFKPSASPQAAVEIPLSQCSVRELLLRWKVCCRSCDRRRPSRSILTVFIALSPCLCRCPVQIGDKFLNEYAAKLEDEGFDNFDAILEVSLRRPA